MKNIFIENTFYKDTAEKEKIEKNQLKIKNIFWLNFVGFVALKKSFPNDAKLSAFLKNDKQLQIDNISDDNSDFSLSVKLFYDAGFLPKSIINKITRFLVIMKQGKDVDESLFRDTIIKEIYSKSKIAKIKASKRVMDHINDFHDAKKTLSEILPDLYAAAVRFKADAKDFLRIARPLVNSQNVTNNIQNQTQTNIIQKSQQKAANITKKPISGVFSTNTKLDNFLNTIDLDSILTSNTNKAAILLKLMRSDLTEIKLTLNYFKLKKSDVKFILVDHTLETDLIDVCNKYVYPDKSINVNFYDVFVPVFFENFNIRKRSVFINIISLIFDDFYSKKYAQFLKDHVIQFQTTGPGKYLMNHNTISKIDINKYFNNITENMQFNLHIRYFELLFRTNAKHVSKDVFAKLYDPNVLRSSFLIQNLDFNKVLNIRKFLFDMGELQKYAALTKDEKTSLYNFDVIKNIFEKNSSTYDNRKDLDQIFDSYNITGIINLHDFYDDFEKVIKEDSKFLSNILIYIKTYDENVNDKLLKILIKNNKDTLMKSALDDIGKSYSPSQISLKIMKDHFSDIDKYIKQNKGEIEIISSYSLHKFVRYFSYKYILENILFYNISNSDESEVLKGELLFDCLLNMSWKECVQIKDDIYKALPKININSHNNDLKKLFVNKLREFPEDLFKKYESKLKINYYIEDILFNLNFKSNNYIKEAFLNFISGMDSIFGKFKHLTNMIIDNKEMGHKPNPDLKEVYEALLQKIDSLLNEKLDIAKSNDDPFSFNMNIDYVNLTKLNPKTKKRFDDFINKQIKDKKLKITEYGYTFTTSEYENIKIEYLAPNFIDEYVIPNKEFVKDLSSRINKIDDLKESTNQNINFFVKLYQKDPKLFNESIDLIGSKKSDSLDINPDKLQIQLQRWVLNNIKNEILISNAFNQVIKSNKSLIKPNIGKPDDLKKALKFNNFNVVSKIRKKASETPSDFVDRVKTSKVIDIPKQDIEPIEMDEETKEKKTVEWFDKHFAGKHGQVFLKVIDSFNVNWNVPQEYKDFKEEYSDTIMKPVFHGTGSIAASMVLRFGFAVSSTSKAQSSGIATAGRMLGDGIYFAPNIDKVAGYASDGSWRHRGNEIGYVFEMEAVKGKKRIHYSSAGTGGDGIKSPEYCVFDPHKQLKILKVYRVQKINLNYVKELKKKYENS